MNGPIVLIGRWPLADLEGYCGSVVEAAKVDNGYHLDNEEQGVPIRVCHNPTRPWSQIWPQLRSL
jgi:hypothetical protein